MSTVAAKCRRTAAASAPTDELGTGRRSAARCVGQGLIKLELISTGLSTYPQEKPA